MSKYAVRHETGDTGGRFVIDLEDNAEAELTYSISGPNQWVANHTGVPSQHGGKGIASLLVKALVATARKAGVKIVPLCSYVRAWSIKHSEEAGIFE